MNDGTILSSNTSSLPLDERSLPPNERELKFTEDLDYAQTGTDSIWGKGYKLTLRKLNEGLVNGGKWIDLASGDGRYFPELMRGADFVVASDIDEGALKKLARLVPEQGGHRMTTKAFDVTKKFPFGDQEFDGAFCAGILHLFPRSILPKILAEFDRIIKPKGRIVIELPTNVRRIAQDGEMITFPSYEPEPLYASKEAKNFLKKFFRSYQVTIHQAKIQENFKEASPPFLFDCTLLLLIADKK